MPHKAAEARRLLAVIKVLTALQDNNPVDAPARKRLQHEIDAYWARLEQLGVPRPN